MTAPAGGQGHVQTLGYWPAWIASGIALTDLAMQLLWWRWMRFNQQLLADIQSTRRAG